MESASIAQSAKIISPFTPEQVLALNEFQQSGVHHPFTCCSHNGCDKNSTPNQGLLFATVDGWVCPCGKYTQNWAHWYMAESHHIADDEPNPNQH